MAPCRMQYFACFGFCLLLFACFVSCLFCCVSCLVPFSVSLHDDGLFGLCTGPSSALLLRPINNQNWTMWWRLFRTFVWSSQGGLQLKSSERIRTMLRRTSIVDPQLGLWDLVVLPPSNWCACVLENAVVKCFSIRWSDLLFAWKALNGLRDASLAWLQLLTFTVEHAGLWSDSLDPCVYGGQIERKPCRL